MANEQEITFDEPDEGRDIYHEPDDRALIRTKDVYQTELDNGVEGYSETMLAIVANFKNAGKPEGFNVQSMVGKSKRGEVALRLFAVVDDSVADPVFVKVGFKSRGCLAMTGWRKRHLLHDRGQDVLAGVGADAQGCGACGRRRAEGQGPYHLVRHRGRARPGGRLDVSLAACRLRR